MRLQISWKDGTKDTIYKNVKGYVEGSSCTYLDLNDGTEYKLPSNLIKEIEELEDEVEIEDESISE